MQIHTEHLYLVDTERFIALLRREPFDYTEWRRGLFKDVSLEEFLENARDFRKRQTDTEE